MLLQSVSKESDCQRGFMKANDIRNTTIRFVSHLAQIPSSAGHLKDVLLLMSKMQRQQLRGIIRASVTLNHSVGETESVAPLLEIKLPVPLEMRREGNALPSATQNAAETDSVVDVESWTAVQHEASSQQLLRPAT
ncbi:hypothetical protein Gotri_020454, partial [Gossypium trilobum]|nr:hypothetical protein [Gossypium trilobum]